MFYSLLGMITHVIAEHVQRREGDDNAASAQSSGLLVVDNGNDELEDTADDQAAQDHDTTTAVSDNDQGVDHDGDQADSAEHTGHAEGVGDLGHRQEIGLVS